MVAHIDRYRRPACMVALAFLVGAVAHVARAQAPVVENPAASAPLTVGPARPFSQLDPQPISHQVSRPVERLEMIVNTSRILTQEQRIPQAQVNNPEVLGLTALSPNQVQIYAKKPGVTQVNLWDEAGTVHAIDVTVYGDVQELARLLNSQFPKAALRLTPISTGVVIQGYVDDPNVQSRIIEIAQNYYPNVINAITIGGVQQVLLQVRVIEVSRTKLQSLGVDMAAILENGSFFASGAAGLLRPGNLTSAGAAATTGREVLAGRVASNGDSFFGFVEALKQNNLAKILADPNLTTVSGRPAFMNAGGEFPVIVPQSLGTVSIEYRRFGTQVDFVPIVMGNGVIRLEIRARVSEIDDSRSVTINGTQVPGLRVREADTAAELKAGQTLATAGLVQTRIETSTRGVPWLMDTPYLGTLFRRTSDQINEVELLIMVTPQLVDGLDPQDLAQLCSMPGSVTTNPGDWQLMQQGHIEVTPDCLRPPHIQQRFPIGAQGGTAADAGDALPGGMMLGPAPTPAAAESLPHQTPVPAVELEKEALKPLPPVDGAAPQAIEAGGAPPATSSVKIRAAAQNRNSASPPANGAAATAPAQSEKSAEPGLIGPIGYDVPK